MRGALALWRGPALAEFAYERFAEQEIARLEELRLAALELRIEADLALGRHAQLIGELEGLVSEHPLRERLRADLMLGLYRSGRQAEALQVYQDARRRLAEELGIDPGQALQELETAILRQDPALELEPSVAAEREPSTAPAIPANAEVTAPDRSILVLSECDENLDSLLGLAQRLARRPPRELILARLLRDDEDLGDTTRMLQTRRGVVISAGFFARATAFTSSDPGSDAIRLVSEQDVDLLLADAPPGLLTEGLAGSEFEPILDRAPCDVAVVVLRPTQTPRFGVDQPVLVPFGGAEHDWTAATRG